MNINKKILVFTLLLLPISTLAFAGTSDDFNNSKIGELNGQNKGKGWTSSWVGDNRFIIEDNLIAEGRKTVQISMPDATEPRISRSFTPKVKGSLHFIMGKDSGDQAPQIILYSGIAPAMIVALGADVQQGRDWIARDAGTEIHLQAYTIGNLDTVDLEFNSVDHTYRVSINGGVYSGWFAYITPVDSIDTLQLYVGNSGPNQVNVYWDDILFLN